MVRFRWCLTAILMFCGESILTDFNFALVKPSFASLTYVVWRYKRMDKHYSVISCYIRIKIVGSERLLQRTLSIIITLLGTKQVGGGRLGDEDKRCSLRWSGRELTTWTGMSLEYVLWVRWVHSILNLTLSPFLFFSVCNLNGLCAYIFII